MQTTNTTSPTRWRLSIGALPARGNARPEPGLLVAIAAALTPLPVHAGHADGLKQGPLPEDARLAPHRAHRRLDEDGPIGLLRNGEAAAYDFRDGAVGREVHPGNDVQEGRHGGVDAHVGRRPRR